MRKLETGEDIWVLAPTAEDLQAGAYYASVSLPWTFNRMGLNTSSGGQGHRALNIAKGIVGQEMLKRKLEQLGIRVQTDRTSHRSQDLFDFNVELHGEMTTLDLKTIHYFTDFAPVGREPFSIDLLMRNAAYAGADWRNFFPMLVPHTQIKQDKEGYFFAIATSIDPRQDTTTDRPGYALTAFPYGRHLEFLSSARLCKLREDASQGIYVRLAYRTEALSGAQVAISILGEWAGERTPVEVNLRSGIAVQAGPFSCISAFQVDASNYDRLTGTIEISLAENHFTEPVLGGNRRDMNQFPEQTFVLRQGDFRNLLLPEDYTLYVIGWIYKEDFLEACRKYTGWVWPRNVEDRFKNQPWTQITDRDRQNIERAGFTDSIGGSPRMLQAGWLKTTGMGGGACCYVFPNIGANRGGVEETNLYVLPQDLNNMNSFTL